MGYKAQVGGMMTLKQVKCLICIPLLLSLMSGCVPSPSAPARDFTTTDLLINPGLLPPDWKIGIGAKPAELSGHSLGYRNNLGGSRIDLRGPTISADHIVARFYNAQDAARSYKDHDHTGNTEGKYAQTWTPMTGFTYRSPIAEQFRVMCVTIKNVPTIGAHCDIEAQYAEFLSIVIYDTDNVDRALNDLELLAKAVDARMEYYLKRTEGK